MSASLISGRTKQEEICWAARLFCEECKNCKKPSRCILSAHTKLHLDHWWDEVEELKDAAHAAHGHFNMAKGQHLKEQEEKEGGD